MNREQVNGLLKEAQGVVTEVTGKIIGNRRLQLKGKTRRVAGRWEHAYYLKYQNWHSNYLQARRTVLNRPEAARCFERSDHAAEQRWEDEGGLILRVMK